MSLYSEWREKLDNGVDEAFFRNYINAEKEA